MRPGCGYFQPPLSEKRARGTPDARCVRSPVCKVVESTRVSSPRKHRIVRRSARDGLSACFALSPATVVTCSPSSPPVPDAARIWTHRQQTGFRSGPHDLGRRARRYEWGASPPRSAPHSVVVHRDARPHAVSSFEAALVGAAPPPGRALAEGPRRDAAASTASRPADRDDRETPLSMGRDKDRYMVLSEYSQGANCRHSIGWLGKRRPGWWWPQATTFR